MKGEGAEIAGLDIDGRIGRGGRGHCRTANIKRCCLGGHGEQRIKLTSERNYW